MKRGVEGAVFFKIVLFVDFRGKGERQRLGDMDLLWWILVGVLWGTQPWCIGLAL